MAFIKTLKDSNDNTIYPQSLISAILDADGNSLDTIHQKFVTATGLETELEDVNTEYENLGNKVTEIVASSTNNQYPSAKAVYNAIEESRENQITIMVAATIGDVISPNGNTIYLIGFDSPYEEYLYINNVWEKIGMTSIDLTPYATKEYVDSKEPNLSEYALKEEIPTQVSKLTNDSKYIANAATSSIIINCIWTGTQEEYNAIETLDENTIYNIIES